MDGTVAKKEVQGGASTPVEGLNGVVETDCEVPVSLVAVGATVLVSPGIVEPLDGKVTTGLLKVSKSDGTVGSVAAVSVMAGSIPEEEIKVKLVVQKTMVCVMVSVRAGLLHGLGVKKVMLISGVLAGVAKNEVGGGPMMMPLSVVSPKAE